MWCKKNKKKGIKKREGRRKRIKCGMTNNKTRKWQSKRRKKVRNEKNEYYEKTIEKKDRKIDFEKKTKRRLDRNKAIKRKEKKREEKKEC